MKVIKLTIASAFSVVLQAGNVTEADLTPSEIDDLRGKLEAEFKARLDGIGEVISFDTQVEMGEI